MYNTLIGTEAGGAVSAGTAAATVTAAEYGAGLVRQTLLTLAATPVALSQANVGGGVLIYTFPQGLIVVLGGMATVTPTTTSAILGTLNGTKTLSFGVGSVITTTQGSGTVSTTEQDLVNAGTCTSSGTINTAGAAGSSKNVTPTGFDGHTTNLAANLNFQVPTASDIDGNATITVSGTVLLTWCFLGDY